MKRNVSTGISTRKKKKGKEKGETMEGKKKGLSLTTQILIATAGGIVFGSLIGPWASNLKFIGDIFIRLIPVSYTHLEEDKQFIRENGINHGRISDELGILCQGR